MGKASVARILLGIILLLEYQVIAILNRVRSNCHGEMRPSWHLVIGIYFA
jgi:hypothetical protein